MEKNRGERGSIGEDIKEPGRTSLRRGLLHNEMTEKG